MKRGKSESSPKQTKWPLLWEGFKEQTKIEQKHMTNAKVDRVD